MIASFYDRFQIKVKDFEIVLLPFLSSLRIIMTFSFVASRPVFARFERLDREVYALLHSINSQNGMNAKQKKGRLCG